MHSFYERIHVLWKDSWLYEGMYGCIVRSADLLWDPWLCEEILGSIVGSIALWINSYFLWRNSCSFKRFMALWRYPCIYGEIPGSIVELMALWWKKILASMKKSCSMKGFIVLWRVTWAYGEVLVFIVGSIALGRNSLRKEGILGSMHGEILGSSVESNALWKKTWI